MTPAPSTDGQLRTHVFIAPMREFGSEGKHWSPCASTLVTGETEAVLTDTGHIKSDVSELGDMIEQTGKRLTTIFITHGHLDHFLGIGQLMKRLPDARPVATPAVVADIKASVADQEKQWQRRFGDDVDKTAVIPEPLDGDVIDLEGHELRVIEVPQGDIAPSTVIHIPSIETVIGGDVVYNRIHMMLALTGPEQWQKWIESIDLVESLGAKTIIAGHKQPDASDEDLDTILNGSRQYIRDFRDAVAASSSAREVIEIMKTKHPDYGNLTTLEFSAARPSRPLREERHDTHRSEYRHTDRRDQRAARAGHDRDRAARGFHGHRDGRAVRCPQDRPARARPPDGRRDHRRRLRDPRRRHDPIRQIASLR